MLAPVQTKAQDPRIELEVRDLEARRFRAMTEADMPTLARSGELIYHSFAAEEFKARAYGNAVLVTGRASAKVRSRSQELNVALLYLEAYVKQDGRWQLAAWESTRVAS